MILQGTDPRMIEALEGASSLQLFQLKALIEGMLADPRRGIAARANLHLGQPVQFVDFRDGQMRRGKIIAMRDTQATVLEEGTKRTRKRRLSIWVARTLRKCWPLVNAHQVRRH